MSLNNTTLDETWNAVSSTLEQIFQIREINPGAFMHIYNLVSKYFCSAANDHAILDPPQIAPKPTKESDKKEENLEEIHKNLRGGELYFRTRDFFKAYLENIASNGDNLQGEDFLRFYAKTWEKYIFSSKVANGVLRIVNQNWVNRQQKDGVKGIFEILTVSMHIWQDVFFKEATQSLSQTCLNLINDERNGARIEPSLIHQVVQSYTSAGFVKAEEHRTDNRSLSLNLATYVDYFEKQFLQDTENFYRLESANFIENNSINEYMKKITKRFEQEERRVKDCLHPTTLEKLLRILVNILIHQYLDLMYVEAHKLLHDEKIEDLRILFNLINRIPRANEPIQQDLEMYAYEVGMDAIDRISANANKDPKSYVEAIINVYLKFHRIVMEGLGGESGYLAALDKAFGKFVNANAVTTAANSTAKSPELLARYCDVLLRKGNKAEESDVEEKINQIMIVFNYVEDKDVFQKYYGRMLGKRLVGQLSASDDYEESMITKLKAACGFEYASKLQRMFQDIRLSTTLVEEYKTYCEDKRLTDTVDFACMVLTSNAWPFSAPPPFNLPFELKRKYDSFTNFYAKKFNGRKLEWLYQHTKGELQTLYTKPKYTLQVSVYQMALLLLFNDFESITVEKMLDKTQIESELLTPVLLLLLKSKVLICSQIDIDESGEDLKVSDIKMDHIIQVDETFKSKKIKMNLNAPIKSVEQKESETVNQSIDEDRRMVVQAAIVRIMKARQSLKHTALIQEVIPQLSSRFKPQISMIKKCIDILIEKEYLERDAKERDLYRYLA